jgi:Uma2 family endonuclease
MSAAVSVSGTKTGTILDREEHYEVINGQRVELPPMGAYQSVLASFIDQVLGPFARMKGLGRVVVETLFQLDREGKLQRKPDIAFVSYKRWPKNHRVPDTKAWDVVPDLAIEVNSPSNTGDEILQKIHDYFRAGVLCVCVGGLSDYGADLCFQLSREECHSHKGRLPGRRIDSSGLSISRGSTF